MWQSSNSYAKGLKRKTPLRRKAPMKRHPGALKPGQWMARKKPMRKKSRKQRSREEQYRPIQRAFIESNPWCQICEARGLRANPATEVHHMRGRNGSLLFDTRFFKSSCYACRLWPHEHTVQARELGVLCSASEWGTVPRPDIGRP